MYVLEVSSRPARTELEPQDVTLFEMFSMCIPGILYLSLIE